MLTGAYGHVARIAIIANSSRAASRQCKASTRSSAGPTRIAIGNRHRHTPCRPPSPLFGRSITAVPIAAPSESGGDTQRQDNDPGARRHRKPETSVHSPRRSNATCQADEEHPEQRAEGTIDNKELDQRLAVEFRAWWPSPEFRGRQDATVFRNGRGLIRHAAILGIAVADAAGGSRRARRLSAAGARLQDKRRLDPVDPARRARRGIASQPGRAAYAQVSTFLPHHEAADIRAAAIKLSVRSVHGALAGRRCESNP